MTIICTIQDNIYLNWQAELLAWNCQQLGHRLTILSGYTGQPSDYAQRLTAQLPGQYISISDTRRFKGYAPSIQPHLLAKHVGSHSGPVLLVDSDVLFRSLDWLDNIPHDGRTVYGSNVGSYIDAAYINGCDPDLLPVMSQAARCPLHIIQHHPHAIGAHYLLPHLFDATFWQTIERSSNNLFALLASHKCKIHQIQTWTASMWAILWELYRRETIGQVSVQTHPAFDFAWATDSIDRYHQTNILHMAGVTENQPHLFNKGHYATTPPWEADLSHVLPETCSRVYANAVGEYANLSQK